MENYEKEIAETIFGKCEKILREEEYYTEDGVFVQFYTVSYFGDKYDLTKWNGEFVYLYHHIN